MCGHPRTVGGAFGTPPDRRISELGRGGLRFAFYGRVSTEDHQDPVTSRARQRDQAAALVAGFGWIVAEFFDVGWSRVLPWARRPLAAGLLAALADPDREFDAIVIGEYERGRSPAPASGSGPRWPPRPASKAATWVAARRTGTGSPTPEPTPTRHTRCGDGGRTG